MKSRGRTVNSLARFCLGAAFHTERSRILSQRDTVPSRGALNAAPKYNRDKVTEDLEAYPCQMGSIYHRPTSTYIEYRITNTLSAFVLLKLMFCHTVFTSFLLELKI